MLITFKSRASPDVAMLENLAQYLLGIVGKKVGERGAIGDDETGAAIAKLEAAIAEDKETAKKENEGKTAAERDDEGPRLAQRAYPLLDMLRESNKMNVAVMWEISSH
ncbi:hypothetical protein PPN31114_02558 [Pandoraea pneumonica]|uniref:DUF1840 domain-containing protein n=1 Tax=Pandoraea pneumonica TaxID=2508299 RepID=A0A5E4VE55_9BURK|nr:DUF1840 domain-containing protein [Pandoraea pneumonica]VVE09305.1 hypothetical protein PPN31114_02558 [Pandoraea pneumonica]